MRIQKVREEVLFYTITIATFLLLAILSVLFLHREQVHNRQMLEIDTIRLATDLIELLRQRSSLEPSDLRSDIVGFGLYGANGKVLHRFGTAPEDILPWITNSDQPRNRLNRVEFKGNRLVILRTLGVPFMGREQMRNMMRGRMKDMMMPFPVEPLPPAGRVVYLELDIREWQMSQRLIQYGFYLVPLLLVLIFIGTTILYRKNLAYRQNELRNRELVQLGEAARTLAHEIKNPLGAIRIQTATLQKVLPASYQRNLQVITEEVDRLRLLVDKVGDFLKNPLGDPEPVDVNTMIQDLLPRFPISISFVPKSAEPLRVWVDRNRFRTVLENILRNAVESFPSVEGSLKDIEPSTETSCEKVIIETNRRMERIEIRVLDRGTGLPTGARDRIFEPFFTTKPTGSGIGLAISKRFVEAAGGTLEVLPRSGGGTEARILLPIYREVKHADSSDR
ncbi:MAG: HAMP domain-containing histidine kinase [Spirochaetes bacterium]|nr:HAMP domain-containing histidine kinase [Spirochaetota bacterium]